MTDTMQASSKMNMTDEVLQHLKIRLAFEETILADMRRAIEVDKRPSLKANISFPGSQKDEKSS